MIEWLALWGLMESDYVEERLDTIEEKIDSMNKKLTMIGAIEIKKALTDGTLKQQVWIDEDGTVNVDVIL